MTPVLVITGPVGRRQGDADQRPARTLPGARSCPCRPPPAQPRPGEVNGREYHFLDVARSSTSGSRAGEFIEHAEYAGNRYGTLRSELERPADGIVLEIDLQGARQVRETLPEATQIFIAPPRRRICASRLEGRALGLRRSRSPAGWRPRRSSWRPRRSSATWW